MNDVSTSTPGPEAPSTSTTDVAQLPFDKALDELRAVVTRLEQGNLALEDSISLYERGVALHDHCSKLLDSAELRVQRLVEGAGGTPRVVDLRPDDGEEA